MRRRSFSSARRLIGVCSAASLATGPMRARLPKATSHAMTMRKPDHPTIPASSATSRATCRVIVQMMDKLRHLRAVVHRNGPEAQRARLQVAHAREAEDREEAVVALAHEAVARVVRQLHAHSNRMTISAMITMSTITNIRSGAKGIVNGAERNARRTQPVALAI